MKKRIIKIVETALLVIIVACAGCNIITGITGKSHIFGYKPMLVMSGSMEPTLKTYQLVLAVPITADEVSINDIVTYKSATGITVVHRIIEETAEGFVFKGDNNAIADEKVVTADQIGYKVIWY